MITVTPQIIFSIFDPNVLRKVPGFSKKRKFNEFSILNESTEALYNDFSKPNNEEQKKKNT